MTNTSISNKNLIISYITDSNYEDRLDRLRKLVLNKLENELDKYEIRYLNCESLSKIFRNLYE